MIPVAISLLGGFVLYVWQKRAAENQSDTFIDRLVDEFKPRAPGTQQGRLGGAAGTVIGSVASEQAQAAIASSPAPIPTSSPSVETEPVVRIMPVPTSHGRANHLIPSQADRRREVRGR